jgi:hypothetical protein
MTTATPIGGRNKNQGGTASKRRKLMDKEEEEEQPEAKKDQQAAGAGITAGAALQVPEKDYQEDDPADELAAIPSVLKDLSLTRKEAEDFLLKGTVPAAIATGGTSSINTTAAGAIPPPVSVIIGSRLLQDVGLVEALREDAAIYSVLERMDLGTVRLNSPVSSSDQQKPPVTCVDAWLDDGTALSILDYSDWDERRKRQQAQQLQQQQLASGAKAGAGVRMAAFAAGPELPPLPLAGPTTVEACQDYVRSLSILLPSMRKLRIVVLLPPAPSLDGAGSGGAIGAAMNKVGNTRKVITGVGAAAQGGGNGIPAHCPPSLASLLGTLLRPTMVLPLPLPDRPSSDEQGAGSGGSSSGTTGTSAAAAASAIVRYGNIRVVYVPTPAPAGTGSLSSSSSALSMQQHHLIRPTTSSSISSSSLRRLGTASGFPVAPREGKHTAAAMAVRRLCVETALAFASNNSKVAGVATGPSNEETFSLTALVSWLKRDWLIPSSSPFASYFPQLTRPAPLSLMEKLQLGAALINQGDAAQTGMAEEDPSPQELWLASEQQQQAANGTATMTIVTKAIFPFLNEWSRLRVLNTFSGCLSALAVAPLSLLRTLLRPYLSATAIEQLHAVVTADHGLNRAVGGGVGGAPDDTSASSSNSEPSAGLFLERAVTQEAQRLRQSLPLAAGESCQAADSLIEAELARLALAQLLTAPKAIREVAKKPTASAPVAIPVLAAPERIAAPPRKASNVTAAAGAEGAGGRFNWAAAERPETAAVSSYQQQQQHQDDDDNGKLEEAGAGGGNSFQTLFGSKTGPSLFSSGPAPSIEGSSFDSYSGGASKDKAAVFAGLHATPPPSLPQQQVFAGGYTAGSAANVVQAASQAYQQHQQHAQQAFAMPGGPRAVASTGLAAPAPLPFGAGVGWPTGPGTAAPSYSYAPPAASSGGYHASALAGSGTGPATAMPTMMMAAPPPSATWQQQHQYQYHHQQHQAPAYVHPQQPQYTHSSAFMQGAGFTAAAPAGPAGSGVSGSMTGAMGMMGSYRSQQQQQQQQQPHPQAPPPYPAGAALRHPSTTQVVTPLQHQQHQQHQQQQQQPSSTNRMSAADFARSFFSSRR